MFKKDKILSNYNIATFILLLMSVQFIYLEGMAASPLKIAFMAIAPLIILFRTQYISKATVYGTLYIVVTLCFLLLKPDFRSSTIYYSILFLLTFNLYYNLVFHEKVYKIDDFIHILRFLVYAYAICLVLQQISVLFGIRYLPIINLMGADYYDVFHLNTLAIEPSHAARLLTVFFYAFLKLNQYKNDGYPLTIMELWNDHKWTIIAFLYTMVCMGSATAFVGIGIVLLYFLKREYIIAVLISVLAFYTAVPYIDYEPLTRVIKIFNAALTGDTEIVTQTDSSAAARINILIETFSKLDLSDPAIWLGGGTDNSTRTGTYIVSAISDYGMFSYISKLVFFFNCCFTSILSLETLMFILLFGLNIGNVAYGFATLMVFATVKYFEGQPNNNMEPAQ